MRAEEPPQALRAPSAAAACPAGRGARLVAAAVFGAGWRLRWLLWVSSERRRAAATSGEGRRLACP